MKYAWYKKGQELLDEIKETILPKPIAALWYIGQMGMIVKWNGLTVCFDPVLNDLTYPDGTTRRNYEIPFEAGKLEADYVVCSHNHADHLNLKTLLPIHRAHPDTRFIVPYPERNVLLEAGIPEAAVIGAKAGERLALLDGAALNPIAAAHETYVTDGEGNQRNLGYVLELGDRRIYHGGDTVVTDELIRDLAPFAPLAAACIPINGVDAERHKRGIIGNMDCRDAAYFASCISADMTFPLHFDMVMKNEENPLVFAYYMRELYPGKKFHVMQLGERYLLG